MCGLWGCECGVFDTPHSKPSAGYVGQLAGVGVGQDGMLCGWRGPVGNGLADTLHRRGDGEAVAVVGQRAKLFQGRDLGRGEGQRRPGHDAISDAMDGLVVMCPDNPELRNSGDVEKLHSMGEELLEFSKAVEQIRDGVKTGLAAIDMFGPHLVALAEDGLGDDTVVLERLEAVNNAFEAVVNSLSAA
jgi:hypothetical protein